MSVNPNDPKGLVREAYNIEGISDPECRSILIDWALSLPQGIDQAVAAKTLLAERPADHPMTALLHQAQTLATPRQRRGGRAGRFGAAKS